MTLQQILVGLQQLASAMAHMHSRGIVHHDVRKANVLLTLGGDALCLVDLGNAAYKHKLNGARNTMSESL